MYSYAVKTDLGTRRDNNEDYYLTCPEQGLWVVADGVGGQEAGEVASRITCETIKYQVAQGQCLQEAVKSAHQAIKLAAEQGAGKSGMASTVVALQIQESQYQVVWVGDSRAYLWREGALQQLSHDQSLVQRLVDENIISQDEARTHPKRNLVTQALGQPNLAAVDAQCVTGEFNPSDKLLLCSDGLSDYVDDSQITQLLVNNEDDNVLVEQLVTEALAANAKDNITVLVIGQFNIPASDTSGCIASESIPEQRVQLATVWIVIAVVMIIGVWLL